MTSLPDALRDPLADLNEQLQLLEPITVRFVRWQDDTPTLVAEYPAVDLRFAERRKTSRDRPGTIKRQVWSFSIVQRDGEPELDETLYGFISAPESFVTEAGRVVVLDSEEAPDLAVQVDVTDVTPITYAEAFAL